MREIVGQLRNHGAKKRVVGRRVAGIRTRRVNEREEQSLDRAEAAVQSVGEGLRLGQRSLLGRRSLVESMLSGNHPDEQHERRNSAEDQHDQSRSQSEGASSRGEWGAHFMLGAGIEPAWEYVPRDFKSLASTDFATRAEDDAPELLADIDRDEKRSGKRDSNPRPQPWQGCALPTELFPQATTKVPAQNDANKRGPPVSSRDTFSSWQNLKLNDNVPEMP